MAKTLLPMPCQTDRVLGRPELRSIRCNNSNKKALCSCRQEQCIGRSASTFDLQDIKPFVIMFEQYDSSGRFR